MIKNVDFKRISLLKVGQIRNKCDFLIKNSIKTGVYEILLADEKCISEIKKITDFDSKAHFIASKGEILSVFLSKLHKYCFGFNLWQEIKFIVKSASERKQNNVRLKYSHEAEKCLLNIRSLGEITNRGIDHIKDVANTAALIDQSDVIEFSHVVEAAECRLFDRNSWLSAYNDKSIPEYNRDNGAILEPWINTVNIP